MSPMRVASFGISQDGKQADVSVIPLGGMAGTDPANVNRWRGQVGLGPLAEAEVSKLRKKFRSARSQPICMTSPAPHPATAKRSGFSA